jgi:hypothetical protein
VDRAARDIRYFWIVPRPTLPVLMGGLLSGLAGAVLFATAHAVLIVPIWNRMWSGLLFGALTGVLAAWAMTELNPELETAPVGNAVRSGIGFGATLWLLVSPLSVLYALVRTHGLRPRYELIEVGVAVTLAIGFGAAFGWYRARRRRAAAAGGLATLGLMLAMGGPVPIERSVRALGIFVSVLPAAAISGGALAILVRLATRLFAAQRRQRIDP